MVSRDGGPAILATPVIGGPGPTMIRRLEFARAARIGRDGCRLGRNRPFTAAAGSGIPRRNSSWLSVAAVLVPREKTTASRVDPANGAEIPRSGPGSRQDWCADQHGQ